LILQFACFSAAGLILFALVAADVWQHRDAHCLLLFLWVVGTFFFTAFLNWSINGRSLLPMAPAIGILIARRIQVVAGKASRTMLWGRLALPLVSAFILGFWLNWSDYQQANSARTAARVLGLYSSKHPEQRFWFAAHSGFQYYMQENGFHVIDAANVDCENGGIFVCGKYNWMPRIAPPESEPVSTLDVSHAEVPGTWSFSNPSFQGDTICTLKTPVSTWLSVTDPYLGANFYSWYLGPLPFAFGRVSEEEYLLLKLTAPWRIRHRFQS
jgi:hypothetical protein